MPEIMRMLKGVTARRINKLSGCDGAFWLAESYNHIIGCDEEYADTWNYIRYNPVAAGYVSHPDEWAWWWTRQS